jgi:hypothetical protein
VDTDHLKHGISGRQELAHDKLEQGLALELLLLLGKLDLELLKEAVDIIALVVVDGVEDLEDGVQDELVEGTLEGLAVNVTLVGPLLGLGVEEAVTLLDC